MFTFVLTFNLVVILDLLRFVVPYRNKKEYEGSLRVHKWEHRL